MNKMFNLFQQLHSSEMQIIGKRTLLHLLLVVVALGAWQIGHAQMRKKPSERVFIWNDKKYSSIDSACAIAIAPDLATYNTTSFTDSSSQCAPGQTTSNRVVKTAINSGNAASTIYTGKIACLVSFTTEQWYKPCNGQTAHYFDPVPNVERAWVTEARMCDEGWQLTDSNMNCVQWGAYNPAPDLPKCGNPTSVGSGCKQETFVLGRIPSGPRTVAVELRYANQFHLAGGEMLGEPSWFLEPADRRLNLQFVASLSLPRVVSSRGHGITEEFHAQANGVYRSFDPQISLVKTASTTPWKRVDYREGAVELYDSLGRLVSLRYFSGGGFDLGYASGTALLPISLTTTTGQQVQFAYTSSRLSSVQLPGGSAVNLSYQDYSDPSKNIAASYLKTITYPDGRSDTFDYVPGMTLPAPVASAEGVSAFGTVWGAVTMNSPSEPGPISVNAHVSDPIKHGRAFFNLSSKTDENSQTYATFEYDNKGRVLVSQKSGNAYRHEFSYSTSRTSVTEPLGSVSDFTMAISNEQFRLGSVRRSAAALPGGTLGTYFAYDSQGNVVSRTEVGVDQRAQCMKADPTVNRPAILLEGLATCPDLDTYTPTGLQRKTSMQWHLDWRVETRIAAPGKVTTLVYNGQPDPTAGNAVTSCAPASALLPDGRPLAVLCKKVEQATTDVNGAAGFAAASQAGAAALVWTWTYDAQGLVATETDPRGSTTSYVHNAFGQLTRKTNSLGHITTYAYNPAGLVSQINEPTGLIRRMTYTPRGWLATSTLSAGGVNLATAYIYTADGQIRSVALPNGHTITYNYDAARRNTGWTDNRGQSAAYTIDPAGNATEEQVRNTGGAMALQIRRNINALNRVQSETVGVGITETFTQDSFGNPASVTNALGQTTSYGRDLLKRINRVTDATSRAATLTYNAQDAVTQVVDFNYVTTNFTRDAQGNARSEATPDAGTTASTYDALGLPSRIVDAIARATDITRDALGRPTLITHSPASGTSASTVAGKTHTTELRYDLTGTTCNATNQPNASRGRLCEMVDRVDGPNGLFTVATTQYQWDAFGRLTRQTQLLSSAIANHSEIQTTALTYRTSGGGKGELATLTYPSGSILTHQYAATGVLSGMLWNGQPLLQALKFNALGQPLSWTWAFGDASTVTSLAATRLYNTAGQLTSSEFATFAPETTGRIGSVMQKLMRSNGAGSWVSEDVPFNALYDSLGQLTSFTAVGTSPVFQWGYSYSYGPNANRTGGTITANGASMSFTSGVQGGTNRQSTAAGVTVTTNAAGDITSLLGKTLAYDAAGRLSEATTVPPCPSGSNCAGQQTTLSRFNGWGQRFLRETPSTQTVFTYGSDGFNLLSETSRNLSTSALSTTDHIWLPTASGPMPIAAVIDSVHYAVHADHLNTPRRLTDGAKAVKWQWPYSGFGEIAPQSTPAAGQAPVSYGLRYPGQIDDGNGLFYNWHRFYDPRVGRYTSSDPIGLEGGWNRFGYVGGNPLSFTDPHGLNPVSGALAGAGAGSAFGPVGTVVGGIGGAVVGGWIGWNVIGPMWAKPPDNARDPNGPKAPGKPGPDEGFKDPKGGENWVPNPNPGKGGSSWGWQDAKGDVWCPSGQGGRSHGGPHWDVQTPGGGYRNERPRRQ